MKLLAAFRLTVAPAPLLLTSIFSLVAVGEATAQVTLVQYDPVGFQDPCVTPVLPTVVDASVTASDLTQIGFINCWNNIDVLPVGQVGTSVVLDPTQYLSFDVIPNTTVGYSTLSYSKQSYVGEGSQQAAVRTSVDSFASNVDSVAGLAPGGADQIQFDVSSLPSSPAPITFRIYFFDAPGTGSDWVDLRSSNAGGTGLILTGTSAPPVGTNYCISTVNSTSSSSNISATGTASISANDLVLEADNLPSQPGIFIAGPGQAQVPFFNGFLCIDPVGLQRFANTTAPTGGVITEAVDYGTSAPGGLAVVAGSTFNYQRWNRDPAAGGANANFSDGLEILHSP